MSGSEETGRRLASALARPDLRYVLILSDGVCVNGSALVKGLRSSLDPNVPISGGLAGEYETDETSPEVIPMFPGGGLAAMQQDLEQRMREMQQQMEDEMPDDIRDIQQRMQKGTATQEEMKQYGQWAQAQAQRFMGEMSQMMGAVMPSLGRPSVPETELSSHVEKLRPILPPDAADRGVVEVLGKQAVFAEEILGEFMQLIGVQPFFAHLSYRYLEECTVPDLLGADIKMVAHLKYKTDAIGG